ncbi:70 kDa peptidyl-prolyl isomerase-like [Rutidosis leptorrhynchoides]|uniref:70 kDa peptidyl-prolyl isomerase-like n=1 Tax=Rutidosis leptorrhynchoides TaxID=125765 RepID=UPI003A9934F7
MSDLPAFDAPMTFKVGVEKEIGDQGLKKKLLKEGEGHDTPDNDYEVEGKVIKGWDQGIKTMKKGENAVFTVPAELAYGESGSPPTIPPNATLQYAWQTGQVRYTLQFDVQLLSWLTTSEKVEAAGKMKEEGDAYFKDDKYLEAAECYEKAAMLIEDDNAFSEEEKDQTRALKVTCYLNEAASKLKLKDCKVLHCKQVQKLCFKALQIDRTNIKALCMRGRASVNLTDVDLAKIDLERALKIDPGNREVLVEYQMWNLGSALLDVTELYNPGAKRALDVWRKQS